MQDHCFISYSHADGLEFVIRLVTELEGGYPPIPVWFEKRDMVSDKDDWDDQIAKAIRQCKCLIYVMSQDSTADHSNCKDEWAWALKYKKPVICLSIDNRAEDQFRLNNRQKIDFTADFGAGMGKLRKTIAHLDSAEGLLEELNHRLADANRDLRRANEEKKALIQADIDELNKQIEAQGKIAANPKAAEEQTQRNIQSGIERERRPEKPLAVFQSSKFINQPPGVEQHHFRDRFTETEQAILFLKNDAQRTLTVVGRGGAGKTAMICRLLKFIENGSLPDDFDKKHGKIDIDGIVYLSEAGSRKVNFANLFEDLCKLLPITNAEKLAALYKEPQTSTDSKTLQLMAAFQGMKQVIVLLDNFENVVDDEGRNVKDAELNEALRAFLHAPHHPVKIVITTRATAQELDKFEPARQRLLPLDTGLQPEYAKEAFILMDEGNLVGIKNTDVELLNLAVERTLGLPRALEALYAALRSDRFTTLKELLELPVLPENVVQAYVGEAFNRLDTNAQKVMQALAIYNRPVTPAAVDFLLAPHLPAMDSAPILQRLANMHFARKESGRFYLHPVDREFAYNLLPEGSSDDTFVEKGGMQLFSKLWDLLDKYPNLLRNEDTFNQAVQNENANIVIGSVMAFQKLDASLVKKMQQEGIFQNEDFLAELDKSFHIPPIWSRYALANRAADYFAQARKPRAEWKKLNDLSAQLAEFDLRCAAGDYDSAASVLKEIDFDYLSLWGHYRLIIEMSEKTLAKMVDLRQKMFTSEGLGSAYYSIGSTHKAEQYYQDALEISVKLKDQANEGVYLGNIGNANADLGDSRKAIEYYEKAVVIAREVGNRPNEGRHFSNMGDCYFELGEIKNAIDYCGQALNISRELQDRRAESIRLGNLGGYYLDYGDAEKAVILCIQSIQIADEINNLQVQCGSRLRLTQAYVALNELDNARAIIEAALQYDEPQDNHNTSALHGIIALRQGHDVTARGAFVRAIGQADEILSKTAEYYSALDAKGLAICGLILCRGAVPAPDGDGANIGRVAPTLEDAIETFRKARKIAPHAGIVKSVLRLFDELMKCEGGEILKDVRNAVEGKE